MRNYPYNRIDVAESDDSLSRPLLSSPSSSSSSSSLRLELSIAIVAAPSRGCAREATTRRRRCLHRTGVALIKLVVGAALVSPFFLLSGELSRLHRIMSTLDDQRQRQEQQNETAVVPPMENRRGLVASPSSASASYELVRSLAVPHKHTGRYQRRPGSHPHYAERLDLPNEIREQPGLLDFFPRWDLMGQKVLVVGDSIAMQISQAVNEAVRASGRRTIRKGTGEQE
jgi:hypothetical protein